MKVSLTRAAIAVAMLSCAGAVAAQSYNPNARYPNPDSNQTDASRRRGPCGDPWVSIALINVYGKADPKKCTVSLYNGGHWNNFNELVHAVAKQKNAGSPQPAPKPKIELDLRGLLYQCPVPTKCNLFSKNKIELGRVENGQLMVVVPSIIGQNGANVIGQNGANILSNNGGNVIGQNGANLINDGGAWIVANNGARLISNAIEMNPPVSPYGGYALQGVNNFRALKDKTRR